MTTFQETTLTIPTMSCNHCVQTITETLTGQAGVSSVQVDLPTKKVHLAYDPEAISLEVLKTKLSERGYPVGRLPFSGRGKPLSLR
jgi:copper chaperone